MKEVKNEKKAYTKKKYSRRLARDSVAGSDEIKRANTIYLPMPKGFADNDVSASITVPTLNRNANLEYVYTDMPWYHTNETYSAYLQRARYPEIVLVARNGLVGLATKKHPIVEVPPTIEYIIEDAGDEGQSIYEIFANCVIETLTGGNVFPTVELNSTTNEFYFKIIECESCIDWDETKSDELKFINFKRCVEERDIATFEVEKIDKNYIYYINETGSVVFETFTDSVLDVSVPVSKQGIVFDEIPVYPIGSQKNCCEPQPSPLGGLYEIALSIYRKDADLSNAEFMTCNPTLCITGANTQPDERGIPNLVGSQVALLIDNPDAKAFYIDTDTSALEHCSKHIQDLFTEAGMYSVSVIGEESKAAEAENTVKLRQGAKNATLINVVENTGKAIKNALKFIARMSGADEKAVVFSPNTDFSEKYISSQMLTALIQAWVARGLSLETLLQNFKDAGILGKEDDAIELEIRRIAAEPPAV